MLPTGGEISIVQALALAGVGLGVQGALPISLPAISPVAMAMVVRSFGARTTVAAAVGVVGTALLASRRAPSRRPRR